MFEVVVVMFEGGVESDRVVYGVYGSEVEADAAAFSAGVEYNEMDDGSVEGWGFEVEVIAA